MSALKAMSEVSEDNLVAPRPIRSHRALDAGEAGFTVIEVMVAVGLFAMLAIGFAGTMGGALNAQLHSRMRTTANQLATQQVEKARALSYDEVGVTGSMLGGTLQASTDVLVGSTTYQVQTDVQYVGDAVKGAFPTGADYKRLVVTVTRPGSSVALARLRTLIAPPTQPSLTKATVDVVVADSTNLSGTVPGVTVDLSGPSGPLRATTDGTGHATFPALPPTAGSQTYTATVSATPAPWQFVAADQVAADTSVQALATQKKTITLRVTRPVPVTFSLQDSLHATFAQPTNVTITSNRGTASYATSTGALGPIDLWSGVTYTIAASSVAAGNATTARFSVPATVVPNTATPTTVTLQLDQWSTKPLTIQVRKPGGAALPSVPVRISGGPKTVLLTGTTDASGNLVVALPTGAAGYTVAVDALPGWLAQSQSNVVVGTSGGSVTLTLAVGP